MNKSRSLALVRSKIWLGRKQFLVKCLNKKIKIRCLTNCSHFQYDFNKCWARVKLLSELSSLFTFPWLEKWIMRNKRTGLDRQWTLWSKSWNHVWWLIVGVEGVSVRVLATCHTSRSGSAFTNRTFQALRVAMLYTLSNSATKQSGGGEESYFLSWITTLRYSIENDTKTIHWMYYRTTICKCINLMAAMHFKQGGTKVQESCGMPKNTSVTLCR